MFARKAFIRSRQWQQVAHKVTLTSQEAMGQRKRPIPVILVSINASNAWAKPWHEKLASLGYESTALHLSPDEVPESGQLTQWYNDMTEVTRNLSIFPPTLVGVGRGAWRVCQKFVSNKPVSALVLIDGSKDWEHLKSHEFEPQFPILMVSDEQTPEFLDGWVDQVKADDQAMQQVTDWIADV